MGDERISGEATTDSQRKHDEHTEEAGGAAAGAVGGAVVGSVVPGVGTAVGAIAGGAAGALAGKHDADQKDSPTNPDQPDRR